MIAQEKRENVIFILAQKKVCLKVSLIFTAQSMPNLLEKEILL